MHVADIGAWQRLIGPRPVILRTRDDYRKVARWWSLEAKRGGQSAADSERYAKNMRFATGLAEQFGPGTWLELHERLHEHAERARRKRAEHLAIAKSKRHVSHPGGATSPDVVPLG